MKIYDMNISFSILNKKFTLNLNDKVQMKP